MITFDDIKGNEQVVTVLRRWAASGKPNHAYIISGQAGSGKMMLAGAFTRELLCQGSAEIGCRCVSCRTIDSCNHPDVVFVRPTKSKSIGVEDIREQVVSAAEIKPYSSAHKVFIIENADLLTVAAQNALLKTLEEPPPYGVLLLLTENADTLLATILSRCVVLKLNPMPIEKRVKEEEFLTLRSEVIGLLQEVEAAAGRKDIVGLFASAARIADHKDNIDKVFDIFYLFYRDVAVYCETGDEEMLIQKDIAELIKSAAKCETSKNGAIALQRAGAVYVAGERLKRNANFQLTIEIMLLDCI